MTRKDVLAAAEKCVCGNREEQYGSPEDSFGRIAELWSAYMGSTFTPLDVAMLMALLKIARIKTGIGTADSFVDLAGYAACGGEIAEALKDIFKKPSCAGIGACNICLCAICKNRTEGQNGVFCCQPKFKDKLVNECVSFDPFETNGVTIT